MLAAFVALVPLIITPGILFYFDVTPKLIALLIGTAIALPLLFPWTRPAGRPARWLYSLAAAQVLSLTVSTVFSRRVELSVWGSNWRSLGLTHPVRSAVVHACNIRVGFRPAGACDPPAALDQRAPEAWPPFTEFCSTSDGIPGCRLRPIRRAKASSPSCARRALWATPTTLPTTCCSWRSRAVRWR